MADLLILYRHVFDLLNIVCRIFVWDYIIMSLNTWWLNFLIGGFNKNLINYVTSVFGFILLYTEHKSLGLEDRYSCTLFA